MSPRLHIVMTCSRPENMPRLAKFYLMGFEPHPWELRWHIMVQGPDPDAKGVRKVNEAFDLIRDGWIFTFADDTEQHPSLLKRLWEVVQANPNAGCVLFAEDRGDRVFGVSPEQSRTGYVCGGQIAYERGFLGDERFDVEEPLHRTDGRLIERLYRNDPTRFVHVNEVLTKENSLEWEP